MSVIEPRYPPRLARLYSAEVRKLEPIHANRFWSGARTWDEAVKGLYRRVIEVGPAKSTKLIQQAGDSLNSIARNERIHFTLMGGRTSKRAAHLMFVTYSIGPHPDLAVPEEGLTIILHSISSSRSRPSCLTGYPVAYISRHALLRLYERDRDIVEHVHVSAIFGHAAILGFLLAPSDKHVGSGLHMLFADSVLLAGAMHRTKRPNGKEARFYDVRTVLPVDELGVGKQQMLEQGRIATAAVHEWIDGTRDTIDEFPDRIPILPRHPGSYPTRIESLVKQSKP